jgi:hypothetical protein
LQLGLQKKVAAATAATTPKNADSASVHSCLKINKGLAYSYNSLLIWISRASSKPFLFLRLGQWRNIAGFPKPIIATKSVALKKMMA